LREAKIGAPEISEGQIMTKFVQNPTKAHPQGAELEDAAPCREPEALCLGIHPLGLTPLSMAMPVVSMAARPTSVSAPNTFLVIPAD
jgi:hypothetical protein